MAITRKKKSDFGEYLTKLIKEAHMSQYEFYTAARITRPYFYDMLSGRTNPPPRETLKRMLEVLEKHLPPDEKRRTDFLNRAAISRGEIPCDIREMILEHPECWDSLRTTLHTMITKKELRGLKDGKEKG